MGIAIHSVARTCASLFTCVAALALIAASPAAAETAPAAVSTPLPELVAQQEQLHQQLEALEVRVLNVDAEYQLVEQQRDKALGKLRRHVVEIYKRGETSGLALLLTSRDLQSAVHATQLRNDLTRYELRLVNELDEAEETARIDREQRDVLSQQMINTQSSLAAVADRIRLTEAAREQRASDRAAKQAARQQAQLVSLSGANAATAAGAPGALVGFNGLGVPMGALAGAIAVGPASAASIDAYLTAKGSPMAGSGFFFMLSGRRWGLDPRLVVAIAGAESNFGNVTCAQFNAWGWACPNNPTVFSSWADGIETINSGLRRYYIDEGRTSVVLIQQKYAPSGAANDPTGLNNHWVNNVSRFLMEQGGNPNQVATVQAAGSTGSDFAGRSPF